MGCRQNKNRFRTEVFLLSPGTRVLTLAILALILASALFLAGGIHSMAKEEGIYKYYTSYQVKRGDSLWSIARDFPSEGGYDSVEERMEEIVHLNHLTHAKIEEGQYLQIPYFDLDYKR